jgi:hypothetical protein
MMDKTNKEKIEALALVADYVVNKNVLDKQEVVDLESRLDSVLASLDASNKYFKRLL